MEKRTYTEPEYRLEEFCTFDYPTKGTYTVWYDIEMGTYGITQTPLPPHCAYATLASLFKAKEL